MNTSPTTENRTPTSVLHAPRAGQLQPPQLPGDCTVAAYELRFRSLFDEGRALAFPCDEQGHVDLDALSPRALNNYCYARALVGREFYLPMVVSGWSH